MLNNDEWMNDLFFHQNFDPSLHLITDFQIDHLNFCATNGESEESKTFFVQY